MECFDPHTNKWSMCAPMTKRRGGVGVATYNNFLYAVGGHDAPASNHCSRLSDCVERSVNARPQLQSTQKTMVCVDCCSLNSLMGGVKIGNFSKEQKGTPLDPHPVPAFGDMSALRNTLL